MVSWYWSVNSMPSTVSRSDAFMRCASPADCSLIAAIHRWSHARRPVLHYIVEYACQRLEGWQVRKLELRQRAMPIDPFTALPVDPALVSLPKADLHLHQEGRARLDRF